MALVLAVVMAVQDPTVRIELDRDRIEVGDGVVLTVEVTSSDRDIVDFAEQPTFDGFSVTGMTRNSVVNYRGTVGVRTTTWTLQLRASAPGTRLVGRVRVDVSGTTVEATPVSITVDEPTGLREEGLAARLRALVETASGPDGTDQVIVSVVPSHDTLVLGEQLDLLVVAWFPRDIRSRLRTRPTLTPPELTGAWTYAQTAALGVLASRDVGGRSYDLFVHHQVVFPLTQGAFAVGPASVSYNLPVRTSILSREIPQEIQSRPITVEVRPRPEDARGGSTIAAAALRLELHVDTAGFAAGEAATLSASIAGRGNVSLWPEPRFAWPSGLRVYPGQTEIELTGDSGIVRGRKTFSYLVIADSAGAFAVPEVTLSYFDLDTQSLREARFPALRLVSRVGSDARPREGARAGMVSARGRGWGDAIVGVIPVWGWVVLGVGPPGALVAGRLVRRTRTRKIGRPDPLEPRGELARLDESFREALRSLIPDVAAREGDRLAAALRAAGVESPVAAQAGRVRDRLRRAAYGPDGVADTDELVAEVREVLNAIPRVRSRRASVIGVCLLCLLPSDGTSQSPTAEQLYQAGGYRQAADSFAVRAAAAPWEPAHWLNLGHALNGAGELARARVAWIRAARLAPREAAVRQTLREAPALDGSSRRLTAVFPVTPAEALLAGTIVWLAVWLGVAVRPSRRVWPGVALAVVALGYAGFVHRHYQRAVALVVTAAAPLRSAPFGSAPTSRVLNEGTAVVVARSEGAWVLVRRGNTAGWVLREDISRI